MLLALVITCLLSKAVSVQITANGDTTADFGSDAQYSCTLADSSGVLQVTWQRLYKDESVENLATYSKRFGRQISHQDKVVFTEASLRSTSIIVKNVTWEDEACYICSFNVYPSGSRRKQICLTVQGVSDMTTNMQRIPGSEPEADVEIVVSCLATGKPAPVIQWNHSAIISSKPPSHRTVPNGDKTFTASSELTLHLSPRLGGYVDCLVNNGMRGQRHERIPLLVSEGDGKVEMGEGELSPSVIIAVVISLIIIPCISCIIFWVLKKSKRLSVTELYTTTEELEVI